MKYSNLKALAPELARLLYQYLVANPIPGDVLVPVPLHPRRLRQRGYNQSALLAESLGKLSGLPVGEDGLLRTRDTLPQVQAAGAAERRANIAGAFRSKDNRWLGKGIILIDDVSTSGATLHSCATALKEGGAATVWALVMALDL